MIRRTSPNPRTWGVSQESFWWMDRDWLIDSRRLTLSHPRRAFRRKQRSSNQKVDLRGQFTFRVTCRFIFEQDRGWGWGWGGGWMNREDILENQNSRWSMHGYILTYSRLLQAIAFDISGIFSRGELNFCVHSTPPHGGTHSTELCT